MLTIHSMNSALCLWYITSGAQLLSSGKGQLSGNTLKYNGSESIGHIAQRHSGAANNTSKMVKAFSVARDDVSGVSHHAVLSPVSSGYSPDSRCPLRSRSDTAA